MKDVFKELKVLGRKRKSCIAQINKDILETIFTRTITFSSTICHFFKLIFEPRFQKKLLFLYLFCLLPRVDPFLREWIFYGGKRTSANQAGVAVHPLIQIGGLRGGCQLRERVCAWLTTPPAFFFPECVCPWTSI